MAHSNLLVQVTLIDKSERFVFKPLLYEVVNGTAKVEEVAPPFIKLLSPYTVNFIQVCPATSTGDASFIVFQNLQSYFGDCLLLELRQTIQPFKSVLMS